MRFIDYLRGRRLDLVSNSPPEDVAYWLDAAIGAMWMPFETGVVGWVAMGRFALRYRRYALLRRDLLPVLHGRIRAHGAGSRITMTYRAPLLYLFIFVAWICFAFSLFLSIGAGLRLMLWPLLTMAFLFLAWVVTSLGAVRYEADDDLAEMLAVVEEAASHGA